MMRQDIVSLLRDMDTAVDAVIVEGKRDKDALRAAGVTVPIYACSASAGLITFARDISSQHEDIAILTDFDAAGKALHKALRRRIPGRKVQCVWRKRLGALLTPSGRHDVESIASLLPEPVPTASS